MRDELIYLITTTSQSVLANGIIPLTTIARKRGLAITNGTNTAVLTKLGYYKVSATVTLAGTEAGTATISLQSNGTSVPGGTSSETITTASTEFRTITIESIIRETCCNSPITLSLVNQGVGITTSNVALAITYLG